MPNGKSPGGSCEKSPKAAEPAPAPMKHVPKGDIFDTVIAATTVPGLLALLVAVAGVACQVAGYPSNYELLTCAFFMGLGKGGVPGSSTLASAFFALLAPAGGVNQMMALVVPTTMMSDVLVGMAYFKSARWDLAGQLLLWTGVGVACGVQINAAITDDQVRRLVGAVFVAVCIYQVYEKYLAKKKSVKEEAAYKQFMSSYWVLAPCGIIGGIASYITNNMGPMLNVYWLALNMDKYALVGTRSATFMSINFIKFALRFHAGDLELSSMEAGFKLGLVACVGVLVAKIWLKHASERVFKFIYERVTLSVVTVSGVLLICGWDLKGLIKFIAASLGGVASHAKSMDIGVATTGAGSQ